MSTATLPAVATNGLKIASPPPPAVRVDDDTMEAVIASGDLSRLTPAQKLQWYKARCDAAGVDPRTQPFQYLNLGGKIVLYATKTCTDQLIGNRHLTVELPERTHHRDLGVYEVRCRVVFPDGRHVEDAGFLVVNGLKGEPLCNALMKCVTKAKRRTVLSACGLGMLDETEVETIAGAQRVPVIEVDRGSPAPSEPEPEPPAEQSKPAPKPPIDPRLPSQARPPSKPEGEPWRKPEPPMPPLDPRDEIDGFLDHADAELPPEALASGKPGEWLYREVKKIDAFYPGVHRSLMKAAHNDKLPVNMLGWGADDVLWAYRSVLGWIEARKAKGGGA